jgi:hypothetical protein
MDTSIQALSKSNKDDNRYQDAGSGYGFQWFWCQRVQSCPRNQQNHRDTALKKNYPAQEIFNRDVPYQWLAELSATDLLTETSSWQDFDSTYGAPSLNTTDTHQALGQTNTLFF